MALRGTLKDFGIADILQLIGHQQKTGVLAVKNKDQEVRVFFKDGTVVRAESTTRQKKELLGRMLVRAEVLSEDQLNRALETQKRTLKRLGQILVESGAIDKKALKTFTKLQSTETIYRLFLWESGTYEFTQEDVPEDTEADPIRSESVLMEGFRQVDEWPGIRKKVTGYNLTFDRLQDLDQLIAAQPADDMGGLDDAFGEFNESNDAPKAAGLKNIGVNERIVYQLIQPGRDVQKIIDLSRLGEFETCKSLVALLGANIIQPSTAEEKAPSADPTVGGIVAKPRSRVGPVVARVVGYLLVLVAAGVFVQVVRSELPRLLDQEEAWGFTDTSLLGELSLTHELRVKEALEVYRALRGEYPQALSGLVDAGLLRPAELHFPWREPYFYERSEQGYALLRPLY